MRRDALTRITIQALEELGCRVIDFEFEDNLPEDLDVIFVLGPKGPLTPVVNRLLACSSNRRPLLVIYQTEQFPNPGLPEWIRYPIALIRSGLERMSFRQHDGGRWAQQPYVNWMIERAMRFRYYGDLHWIKRSGLNYLIPVESPWTANFLRERGLNTIATDGFWYPNQSDWGADLSLARDIPVLWMGKYGSNRRKALLRRIRTELGYRGVDLLSVDGVEHPYADGKERTVILNRTKVVLNLLRRKWDNNLGRFYLAALNRAIFISEPMFPHSLMIVPGKHFVESPVAQLPEVIAYYVTHDPERKRITDAAYELVTKEITINGTLGKILDAIPEQDLIR
jgi:hypothetical protein